MGCFGLRCSRAVGGGELGLQQIAPGAEEGLVLLRGFGQPRHVPCLPGHRLLHRPHLCRNLRRTRSTREREREISQGRWA